MTWTRGTLELPEWPQHSGVDAVIAEHQRGARAAQVQAEIRETLVARGVIPASWLERIYKYSSKQSIAGRSRFQHAAVMVLARDAARACAADALAASLFGPPEYSVIWTTASHIRFIRSGYYRGSQASIGISVEGLWRTPNLVFLRMPPLVRASTLRGFLKAYELAYPAWMPLLDLGVMPWLLERGNHKFCALVCNDTPPQVQFCNYVG